MSLSEAVRKPEAHWGLFMLKGTADILFGAAILAMPGIGLAVLILLFGAYAVADGVVAIIIGAPRRVWLILAGALSILAGLAAFAMPLLTTVVLVYVLAGWSVALGIFQVFDSVWGVERVDWLMALAGLSSLALGTIILMNPGLGLLYVVVASGVYAVISGAFFIMQGFRLHGGQDQGGLAAA